MPIAIHGHFYQPPREHPWTGAIPVQPDAAPFHDWNERVYQESYRPNAFCWIPTSRGNRIVNNFERISFDVGPTLMSWISKTHPETHVRIVEADQKSLDTLGHGNAIAQAYHHTILPLSSRRDVITEVRWGLADFRSRFERPPDGMWLPETAADDDVLGILIDEGISFTVLAPWQAAAWQDDDGRWVDAVERSVDTRVGYRYFHPDGSGRWITLFFYDGGIAQAIAFERAGSSAERFLDLFEGRAQRSHHLIHAATDGETYGHHHKFTDIGLAYALFVEGERRGLDITNYAAYLERFPAQREVRLVEGATSWSCVHGVARWEADCGCSTGGQPGWNQAWRAPLRRALTTIKDIADELFLMRARRYFSDPWEARDHYIDVVLGIQSPAKFFAAEAARPLTEADVEDAAKLLELQRFALAMFTSCGWFFNDVSGVETIQVMRYAARTIELLDDLGAASPLDEVLSILAEAPSNRMAGMDAASLFREVLEHR